MNNKDLAQKEHDKLNQKMDELCFDFKTIENYLPSRPVCVPFSELYHTQTFLRVINDTQDSKFDYDFAKRLGKVVGVYHNFLYNGITP